MAINEEQLSAVYQARNAQNRKRPMLINIDDGRLMPNVPRLGGRPEVRDQQTGRVLEPGIPPHPKYRVYMGDPNATREERMRVLRVGMGIETAPIFDTQPTAAPFDIATASAEELVAFAQQQYGMSLSPNTPVHLLRGRVKAAAEKANDLA